MADGRSLHIGIDGRELVGHPTGVGRFLAALLNVWATDATLPHRFTVFLPAPPPPALAGLGPRVTWTVDPAAPAGTWWEQARLPRAAARARVDVFFAPGYTAPLRLRCPIVLVIHDVSFFAHPEWFGWREGLRRRWLTRASARRARTVITVSEFSAAEIARYLGVPRAGIRVAAHGAPDVTAPPDGRPRPRLVLYVGSLFNRRRIPDLLRGFAVAAARVADARLVLVGDNRTNPRVDPLALARDLGLADRVEWRAYVPDADLGALYRSARVFAFLSDYEGFGMTPLEAIAAGAPPVLLDTEIAREVYGDAALLVPPAPDAIGQALTRLLTDDAAHDALVAAGRRRLDRFSWPRAAAAVRQALEDAARTT